jgi:hypothetical protein
MTRVVGPRNFPAATAASHPHRLGRDSSQAV